MQRVLALADGVAQTPATVLLTGESGTGKEVLARFIHSRSDRSRRPFVAINCGALPATLVESELFGHEKGAFSGATERRVGRFEAAHHGTLLLDEISEMPLELQTRLLRVLQEREIHRVGSASATPIDVRVVATSNRDLKRLVAAGQFRQDLYYRINVFPIHLPPLRERLEDVPGLSSVILNQVARRWGRPTPRISDRAMARLADSRWPGNVRELSNALERALIIAKDASIQLEDLLLEEPHVTAPDGPMSVHGSDVPEGPDHGGTLRDLEQDRIIEVLRACNGNRTHAAKQLGISIRTLRNRLREYRLMGLAIPASARSHLSTQTDAQRAGLSNVG